MYHFSCLYRRIFTKLWYIWLLHVILILDCISFAILKVSHCENVVLFLILFFPRFMRYCFICIITLAQILDIAIGTIQCLTITYSYDYKRNIIFIDVEGQDIVKVEQFFIKNVTYVSFFLLKFQISFTG